VDFTHAKALDRILLSVPKPWQYIVAALTLLSMLAVCVPNVPRQYCDYSQTPFLRQVQQYESYGTDTIADMYAAKVILNDASDMYTREKLDQTPQERATWTKEESAPYPPMVLLAAAGLYALGEWTGIGYYGMILMLAALFVALSLNYFLQTRWYLFPVLYLNFAYFGYRFVYVQDGSYLIMLVVVIVALYFSRYGARYGKEWSHALMAVAISMKLSPLYYVKNVLLMKRWVAAVFMAILFAGFVLPYFIWDNYLYIYGFHDQIKGNVYDTLAAIILVVLFSVVLSYVETRLDFDQEDRVGWALVPFALFLAIKMRVARHLLIVLLVPDKRGPRNIAAAIGLALHLVLPGVFRMGSVLYITTALLFATLIYYLNTIGWDTVRDDFRHPARTAKIMLTRRAQAPRRSEA
jgi:hypothetical protein